MKDKIFDLHCSSHQI